MSAAGCWLLCLALAEADGVAADDLQTALTAAERQLQDFNSLKSLEVTYRISSENPPEVEAAGQGKLPELIHVWRRAGRRQYYSYAPVDDPEHLWSEWAYDGQKTVSRQYSGESGELLSVWIEPNPPRNTQLIANKLDDLLGSRLSLREEGLAAYCRETRTKDSLAGARNGDILDLSLGSFDDDEHRHSVFLTLDVASGHRLVAWSFTKDKEIPFQEIRFPALWKHEIEEFQQVQDETDGSTRWFPKRGAISLPLQIHRIVVDSVRINHAIPNDRFSFPSPPFGTEVTEMDKSGKSFKRYRVGGEDAEAEYRAEIEAKNAEERERLDREGVRFNATPPASKMSRNLAVGGVVLLILGGILAWRRNRK